MLPGPFQFPSFPGIPPSYMPPLVFWLLVLGTVVVIVITLYRFLVAEPDERISSFLVFLLVLALAVIGFFAIMNGPAIAVWFRKVINR